MDRQLDPVYRRGTGLVDVLDRVLDKGLVVAGDIKVELAEVDLLTIRIRLIVCSIDKAESIGLDWWKHDRYFAGALSRAPDEEEDLRVQVRLLEEKIAELQRDSSKTDGRRRRTKLKEKKVGR